MNRAYLQLVSQFAREKSASVVGFKLQSHRRASGLLGVEAADQGADIRPQPDATRSSARVG